MRNQVRKGIDTVHGIVQDTGMTTTTKIERVRCADDGCGFMIGYDAAIEQYGPLGPLACPRCGLQDKMGGWPSVAAVVRGRVSTKTICDARCVRGTGTDCLCSCGGWNHGSKA